MQVHEVESCLQKRRQHAGSKAGDAWPGDCERVHFDGAEAGAIRLALPVSQAEDNGFVAETRDKLRLRYDRFEHAPVEPRDPSGNEADPIFRFTGVGNKRPSSLSGRLIAANPMRRNRGSPRG